MKKGITRAICCILIFVLALSVFVGCGKKEVKDNTETQTSKPSENTQEKTSQPQQTEEEGSALPIVDSPITIRYWVSIDGKPAQVLKNFNEMAAYKELEKLTNVKVEFLHPPVGQSQEQFNLMISSGDFPDVIEYSWRNVPGGPAKMLEDKIIIKLNELIDNYSPNLKKIMIDNPEWEKQAVLDDGSYYMYPFIRDDDVLISWRGFQIRKDWLDKLDLQIPNTIDEWYAVLKAFKENDPNGNGQNDEIPFAQFGQVYANGGFLNFMFAWGLAFTDNGFTNRDGKVIYSYIQPEYKEFLETMTKWYEEGLIDPEYLVVDRKLFDTKMMNEQVGSCVGGPEMGFLGYYMKMMQDKNKDFVLEGVTYPIGAAGKSYGWKDNNVPGVGASITTSTKYQKEIAKWLDYAYSEEGRLLLNFGPEGQAWSMVDGNIKFNDSVTKAEEGFDSALTRMGRATFSGPMIQHRAYVDQGRSYFEQQSRAVDRWKAADESLVLPPISPTTEESQRFATIMNEVNTYVSEMRDRFIMGEVSLDQFDEYVANIKKMNIDEATEIMQSALDRYNER